MANQLTPLPPPRTRNLLFRPGLDDQAVTPLPNQNPGGVVLQPLEASGYPPPLDAPHAPSGNVAHPDYFSHPPLPTGRDEREGWFGRTQRPGGDINLPAPTLGGGGASWSDDDVPAVMPKVASPNLAGALSKPPVTPPPSKPNEYTMRGISPDVMTTGTMIYSSDPVDAKIRHQNGPRLNTEEALAGLKAHDFNSMSRMNSAPSGDPHIPGMNYIMSQPDDSHTLEGMFRLANRDPSTVAPGANQFWNYNLHQQIDPAQKLTDARLQNQIDVEQAHNNLNPAIQQGAENDALRKGYPAQYQAQGVIGAADKAGFWELEKQKLIEALGSEQSANLVLQAMMGLRTKTMGIQGRDPQDMDLERVIDPAIAAGLKSRNFVK